MEEPKNEHRQGDGDESAGSPRDTTKNDRDPRLDGLRGANRNADDPVVDEASEESFPASDPPSWTPSHSGEADRKGEDQ